MVNSVIKRLVGQVKDKPSLQNNFLEIFTHGKAKFKAVILFSTFFYASCECLSICLRSSSGNTCKEFYPPHDMKYSSLRLHHNRPFVFPAPRIRLFQDQTWALSAVTQGHWGKDFLSLDLRRKKQFLQLMNNLPEIGNFSCWYEIAVAWHETEVKWGGLVKVEAPPEPRATAVNCNKGSQQGQQAAAAGPEATRVGAARAGAGQLSDKSGVNQRRLSSTTLLPFSHHFSCWRQQETWKKRNKQ